MATISSSKALARLRELGYDFNQKGQLRKIDTDTGLLTNTPYLFEISKDDAKNQQHYEKFAEQIPEIVYDLLEQIGLERVYIPENVKPELGSFIFTNPEKLKRSKKLLVLVHGSGYVRAGQWARSLIINHSLDHGSQLPYIKKAQKLGYDLLVMNTNDNYRVVDGKRVPIEKVSNPTSHARYVWDHLVVPSEVESIAIVAHSYGGTIIFDLVSKYPQFFKDKVFAIALTDSAHGLVSETELDFLKQTACNWSASHKPLDKPLTTRKNDVPRVSAGHPLHEWSSYSAIDSIFKFFEEKYKKFIEVSEDDKDSKLDSL